MDKKSLDKVTEDVKGFTDRPTNRPTDREPIVCLNNLEHLRMNLEN